MTATAITLEDLPVELQRAFLAEALQLGSDPITDKRYQTLARSGSVVAEYLTWKKASGADEETIRSYERALARMVTAYPSSAVEDFDAGQLLRFIADHPGEEHSKRTKVYAPLRDFWKWAVIWKRLPANPMDMLPSPKAARPRIYDTFTPTERAKIVQATSWSVLPKRDKAAYLLYDDTGARKTDVRLCQWREVNLADRYVIYRNRKGDQEGIVTFGHSLQEALLDAFHSPYPIPVLLPDGTHEGDVRAPELDDYVLFPAGSNAGSTRRHIPSWIRPWKPMSDSGVQGWWEKLLVEADVTHRRLHMTRHTHGTELYEATGDIEEVRRRLGHASLTTTQIYVHQSPSRGRAAVEALEVYRAGLRKDGT